MPGLINVALINDILCVPESHSSVPHLLGLLRINSCPDRPLCAHQGWGEMAWRSSGGSSPTAVRYLYW